MAKAHIQTPDGVSVNLEGTPEEISSVLKGIKVRAAGAATPVATRKAKAQNQAKKTTIASLIEELRDEGFFKKPRSLAEIRSRLADLGHAYPLTGLSGPMQREVRARRLRRFREKGKYVYAR